MTAPVASKPGRTADFTLVNFDAKAGNGGKLAGLDMEVGTKRLTILADLDRLKQMHRVIGDTIRKMEENRAKRGGS